MSYLNAEAGLGTESEPSISPELYEVLPDHNETRFVYLKS